MSSRYNPTHGNVSLQANFMASFVAVVPLMWMNDVFSTLTADVCNLKNKKLLYVIRVQG